MQLFYNPEINNNTDQIVFNKEESRHIVRVLRKKELDSLNITNGNGFLFEAKIIVASDKKCIAEIVSSIKQQKAWDYYLHVAIAPTKNIDRLEWFLEKATEIGIDEITPLLCQNSERKIIKKERLEKIMLSAMKQSLKFQLPKLNELTSFSDFLNQQNSNETICIAHCELSEKKKLSEVIKKHDKITILIGPEGDFSAHEIQKSTDQNIIPITLGESRLRTETAGLVAVQNISFLHQL